MAHSLSFFIIGKDVFEYIERQFIRAIKGEIQSQAVAVNVQEGLINFKYCILTSMSTDVYSYSVENVPGKSVHSTAALLHVFEGLSGAFSGSNC